MVTDWPLVYALYPVSTRTVLFILADGHSPDRCPGLQRACACEWDLRTWRPAVQVEVRLVTTKLPTWHGLPHAGSLPACVSTSAAMLYQPPFPLHIGPAGRPCWCPKAARSCATPPGGGPRAMAANGGPPPPLAAAAAAVAAWPACHHRRHRPRAWPGSKSCNV